MYHEAGTDKHYCSVCGEEVDGRDMCGFTEQTTCLACGYTPTDDPRMTWFAFLFIPLFGLLYWVATMLTYPGYGK